MELVFVSALVLGFFTGFHCIGMCGPIAISMGISSKRKWNFFVQNLSYQMGRLMTYSVLGLLIGIFGSGFSLVGLQAYVSIFGGIVLILMSIDHFLGKSKRWNIPILGKLVLKVKLTLGKNLRKNGVSQRFFTGALNGLLPCGMVYVALTSAIAFGDVWSSTLYMALFGLGTFPMMFAVVWLGNLLQTGLLRTRIFAYLPVLVFIMGIIFILRGMELGIPYISPSSGSLFVGTEESCCHP